MAQNQKLEAVDPRTLPIISNPSGATFIGYSGAAGAEQTCRVAFASMTPLFGVVQTTGTSILSVMSQKAVTDALAAKANISQVIDSSVSNSPSSYIVGLALAEKTDKKNFYNVSQGTNNFAFTSKIAARTAVLATYRALGQIIGYKLATGELIFEAFKGTILTGTGWTADTNWVSVGGIDSNLLPANTETTITTIVTTSMLRSGTLTSGVENANDTRLRTSYLNVSKKPFTVNIGPNYQFRVSYFDDLGTPMLPEQSTWSNSGSTDSNARGASNMRLVIRNLTDSKQIIEDLGLSIIRSQNILLSPYSDFVSSSLSDLIIVTPSSYLPNIYSPILLQGSLGTAGEEVSDLNRVYSEKVYVNKLPFDILLGEGFQFLTRYFNASGTVIYSDPAWTTGGGTFSQVSAVYIQTIIRRNPEAPTIPSDVTSFKVNTRTKGEKLVNLSRENVYNVLDYGVSTFNYDNSTAVQALVDLVAVNGGGTIFFPVGTYNFRAISGSGNSRAAIVPHSNVSFVGESITGTVLKMTAQGYYALFNRQDETKVNPLVGCKFSNFTVDAYDVHPTTTYTTVGKAFYFQNVVNGIFRDLIIKGTPSTSVGIDFLVNVIIDNVLVVEGGRLSDERRLGGSGIGIGLDFFDEENFIISNCTTIGCGNYGIFIESQRPFESVADKNARGMIIHNCISRNNKNTGIGVRTGRKVLIDGCVVYGNLNNGVELKWKIDGVKLSNCIISDNVGSGILIDTTTYNGYTADIKKLDLDNNLIYNNTTNGIEISGEIRPFADVTIKGNTIYDNPVSGINVKIPTTGLALKDNITKRNPKGLIISSNNQIDMIVDGNIFMEGTTFTPSQFTGNTDFNDLI
ncbi:right-handed parallel beta-helix repeat-containing protein [Dysgonomonas sp. ZJ709]|uniref:right-handed parallel beta-helix repeat-containing protein n=1 Tax=Dysgonomonas sp. ZJ709 TaxID=2709797 RepID=UPI0013EAC526|nr:right-handed parallel beta-helix repeat-containing protein [Dysgonomonas sp. ZJ709]